MKIDAFNHIRHLDPARKYTLAAAAVLFVLSMIFWLIAPGLYQHSGQWAPYHTVSTDRDPQHVPDLISDADHAGIVSEVVTSHTTDVLVTRFNRLESVTLSDALAQLDPLDPRRDPFIAGISRYFGTGEDGRSLLYLRSDARTRDIFRLVRRALGGGSTVEGWEPVRSLLAFVIFAAGCGAILVTLGKFRLIVALGFLPWVPAIAGAAIPGAVGATLIVFAWVQALAGLAEMDDPGSQHGRLLRLAIWPVLVATATFLIVYSLSGIRAALTILPGVAGLTAVTALVFVMKPGALIHRDHDLFVPVSILTGRSTGFAGGLSIAGSRIFVVILAAAAIVLPPVADRLIAARSPALPRQFEPREGNEPPGVFSYDNIGALWWDRDPDSLVDISDYVAHRAYQQSLAFGRTFGPPEDGETVTLSRFTQTESGAYTRYEEQVLVFDEGWLEETVENAPAGIATMLASSGMVSGVVSTPEHGLYSGYSQLLKHTAFVLLSLIPAALSGRRLPRQRRRGSMVVEIARRRKQVA